MCMICDSLNRMSTEQVISNLFEMKGSIDKSHQRDIILVMSKRDFDNKIDSKTLSLFKKAMKGADWYDSPQHKKLCGWAEAKNFE